jgi:hypothetical protein
MQKQHISAEMPSLPSSASEEGSCKCVSEENAVCGLCHIKQCHPIPAKFGAWVQCQGKVEEVYHESCVSEIG